MTPEDVRARVAFIASIARDDEHAHVEQDKLFRDVLSEIASEASDEWAAAIAREALAVDEIEFARWCA